MPSFETRGRLQKAVLWERQANNAASAAGYDEAGRPIVKDPIELDVRWENEERQVMSRNGTMVTTSATVVVDRYIPEESIMALGTLSDIGALGTADAIESGDLMEVVRMMEIPSFDGRFTYREAMLKRFRGTLPEIGDG